MYTNAMKDETTIRIPRALAAQLKRIKAERGAKSIAQIIESLLEISSI